MLRLVLPLLPLRVPLVGLPLVVLLPMLRPGTHAKGGAGGNAMRHTNSHRSDTPNNSASTSRTGVRTARSLASRSLGTADHHTAKSIASSTLATAELRSICDRISSFRCGVRYTPMFGMRK